MLTRICSYSTTHRLSSGMDEMHCARLEFAKIVSSLSSSFSSLLFVSFPPLQLRLDFYENDRKPDFILSSSLPTANHQRNRTQRSTAHSYGRNRQARGESEARQSSPPSFPLFLASSPRPFPSSLSQVELGWFVPETRSGGQFKRINSEHPLFDARPVNILEVERNAIKGLTHTSKFVRLSSFLVQ